jgi:hypothetical protein
MRYLSWFPPSPTSRSSFNPLRLTILNAALLCIAPAALSAQTVTFAGTAPVNFGNVNLCAPGATSPAPCSKTLTLTYNVTGSGTLGAIKVVTGGASNLDFTLASGSTCTGAVTEGATCVVNVEFVPKYAGYRPGAVQIKDESGKVLATTPIVGFGAGAQIGFSYSPPIVSTVLGEPALGMATDGAGDLFVMTYSQGPGQTIIVVEFPAAGGAPITLPITGLQAPYGIAVDEAGDVFVADTRKPGVVELPAGAASQTTLPFTFEAAPTAIAADSAGNVFVTDYDYYSNNPSFAGRVLELPAGATSQKVLPFTGLSKPQSVAVDDAEDVFVLDSPAAAPGGRLLELPHGGTQAILGTATGSGDAFFALAVNGLGDLLLGQDTDFNPNLQDFPAGGGTPLVISSGICGNSIPLAQTPTGALFCSYGFDQLQGPQPPNLSFGPQDLGSTHSLPVTVVNTGTETLIASPSFNNPSYSIVSQQPENCLAGIAPRQSCNLEVQFAPAADGAQNGSLSFQTNGIANPVVTLQGTGISPGGTVTSFNFSHAFQGAQGLIQFNGTTALDHTWLELTNFGLYFEAGSAFYNAPVNVQSFTTDFTFNLSNPTADGLTFTIQNAGPTALGTDGAGLGYASIPKSVAIKFDLYNDAGEGPNSTGIYTDGAMPTVPAIDLTAAGFNLHDNPANVTAHVTYDGANLTVTLSQVVDYPNQNYREAEKTWSHSFPINIPATVGGNTAFIGFTGSTGAAFAKQEITSWTYAAGRPAATPPPNYSSGFTGLGLNENGSAGYSLLSAIYGELTLTDGKTFEAASAFYGTPVNIQSFNTDFTFHLDGAADGITFTIQNNDQYALGSFGEGLGYSGIGKSVAIKFDVHDNAGEGSDSTGLYVNGAVPTVPSIDLTGTGIYLNGVSTGDNPYLGNPIKAQISYDGSTLTLTLTDTVTLATYSHSFSIDIPATVGGNTAYVGFTGGTGKDTASQQILNWTFTNP